MREHSTITVLILKTGFAFLRFFSIMRCSTAGWGAFCIDGTAMPLGNYGPGIITSGKHCPITIKPVRSDRKIMGNQ